MTTTEEILRNRVKFIGDNEWTLSGTPAEVIKELSTEYNRRLDDIARSVKIKKVNIKLPDTLNRNNGYNQAVRDIRDKIDQLKEPELKELSLNTELEIAIKNLENIEALTGLNEVGETVLIIAKRLKALQERIK